MILLLVSVLALTGCQSDNSDKDNTNNDEPGVAEEVENGDDLEEEANNGESEETEDNEDMDTTRHDNIKVSVEDAFDLYKERYPEAKVNEIELEKEDNIYEYKIEGYDGNTQYELEIHAFTKKILDEETEIEDDEHGEIRKDQLDKIDKYVKEALDDAGSEYWVDEWELEAKSDYIKFDIDLKTDSGNKLKYKYNYDTGELLKKKD